MDVVNGYPIDMFHLIDIILESSTIEEVTVQDLTEETNSSWIYKTWSSLSTELQDKCKEKGLRIEQASISRNFGKSDPVYEERFSITIDK